MQNQGQLQDIPQDWRVGNLGEVLTHIDAGKSPLCVDQPAGAGEWGVLKVSAVRPTGLQTRENKVITKSIHVNPSYEVKDGDLLITRANTYELVGLTCLVKNPPSQLLISDKTLRLNVTPASAYSEFIRRIQKLN